MIKVFYLFFLSFFAIYSFGQNLYNEKFNNCKLDEFCLDCGDTKAEMPQTFKQEFIKVLGIENLNKVNGGIEIQILIDASGKPCLLSANNQTNIQSDKLNLQNAINSTSVWKPAISGNIPVSTSVSLQLTFQNADLVIKRINFDFSNQTNEKSVGKPNIEGTERNKLSETWTVYTQQNSELPWDMTRAVANDLENNIWIGTDNGIVKIKDGKWQQFNFKNTIVRDTIYNKNQTPTVRDLAVDKNNNKWFIIDWDVYKYDNEKWTKYDSTNSPINWARTIFVDKSNNIWFTSWDGIAKFDGINWTVINSKNSNLPTDKTLSAFVIARTACGLVPLMGILLSMVKKR